MAIISGSGFDSAGLTVTGSLLRPAIDQLSAEVERSLKDTVVVWRDLMVFQSIHMMVMQTTGSQYQL
ncbi:MAG: hypothetical protein B6D71_06025 [gamma proteobacterium symbiont of Stewartia floridana]|nr:MAG: hypothetical protein B6D76_10670 [gamma proteobacterium symbiont of Stewartia floridana]RLW62194.1 MAG: hypothetical protein B6D75_00035 [gamma proteobacterium symbiont of Stewartia floridana]RLW70525.1 MAG: hypothetical protein B6D71_06025 [gamma proteobacterium symbiont of Stewartia floridana]